MQDEVIKNLTRALYRVTDRLTDREPLKWQLRENALKLENLLFQKEDSSDSQKENREMLFAALTRNLELASSFSYVARINFEVLLKEYLDNQKIFLEEKEESILLEAPVSGVHEVVSPSTRQKYILDILSTSANVSIADFVKVFEGKISEKTVQRELNELISQGKIKAFGERRWRRYSLPL